MKIFNSLLQIACIFAVFSCSPTTPANEAPRSPGVVGIIPVPAEMVEGEGAFVINKETTLFIETGNSKARQTAEMFATRFKNASGLNLNIQESDEVKLPESNSIFFTTKGASEELTAEGYTLTVAPEGVMVQAIDSAGLFYGMQTLKQLLPAEIESKKIVEDMDWVLPVVKIQDHPAYKWRGLHLDVGRHMTSVPFIKEYLDNMAMHKLNTFHWHLTEDQGWRIEIKKYPKLTEIGAWRDETLVGHAGSGKYDGKRYGGFYTQEEVKEIVAYAAERYITVVPEIEMPGHSSAAIASYPELSITGKPVKVVREWGVFPDIYNVDDKTFEFLENVLTEVMELFPGKYIHIGGDEAPKKQWEESPEVQAKIKELGLKDEHELQSWFITRIEKFVNSKGRQIIGWDEILEGGLAPNAAVMSWRGEAGGIEAAKSKHFVVMSPGSHMYFDHYQGDPKFEPIAFGGFTPLEKVYSYNPTPDTLSESERKYILGAQANVWTEYITSEDKVEYRVFPRISALSEVLWSEKEDKDWEDFKARIPNQLKRYEFRDINYSKSIYHVTYDIAQDTTSNTYTVALQNQMDLDGMHYTLDGTEPSENSSLYKEPLKVDEGTVIKAGLYQEGALKGIVTEIKVSKPEKKK